MIILQEICVLKVTTSDCRYELAFVLVGALLSHPRDRLRREVHSRERRSGGDGSRGVDIVQVEAVAIYAQVHNRTTT